MPPPMPNPSKRMTAQPSRPVARYRPGKPTAEEESSDDEESEDKTQQKPQKKVPTRPQPSKAPVQTQNEDEDDEDDEEGFVTDPEDEEDGGVPISAVKPAAPATRSTPRHSTLIPQEDEDSVDNSSEEASESESESAQSSSSEDESRRKFQRPIFLRKADRNTSNTPPTTILPSASPRPNPSSEQARRIAETDTLIADKIQRDARARATGKKAWDDDDDVAPESQVDDTDNLDPAAEHQAWRLRELTRLKRDREAMIARETEIEELERRRNLTVEEREKEDKQFLSKQKEDRDEGRGQSGYLARYHHKGAFFQDDEAAEILKKRDVMGAKFVDDVADKSALPEYMRIRDMTKLGKKGRTRYKDLRSEDTGTWGEDVKRWRGAGDTQGQRGENVYLRGVDERFLPDNERERERGGPSVSGANASAVGERRPKYKSRSRSRSRSWSREKERDRYRNRSRSPRTKDTGNRDSHRPSRRRSYSRSRSASRSRSRSPPRRKRSPPSGPWRSDEHDDRTKRRRVVHAV